MPDDATTLRLEAKRCRLIAESVAHRSVREMILRIADEYESAANRLESERSIGDA